MLGDLSATSVAVWMYLPEKVEIRVTLVCESNGQSYEFDSAGAARIHSVRCEGLEANRLYTYEVTATDNQLLGQGGFRTPPFELSSVPFKIAFGTCYHKIGMYRPELMRLIRERGNLAMLILGDSAVDGRKDDFGLIQADYLLRDLSPPWQDMAANLSVSAVWDDHDYWGNDTSGRLTNRNEPIDVEGLRRMWKRHWNNPQRRLGHKGIYFSTRIGPVHYIALDTRSCRNNGKRGQLYSFLGKEQMDWLRQEIETSDAAAILISSGTMWSDYISAGKDSWGTWDTEGREQVFQWIDAKKESKVILLSGDRHGARGFAIPRPDGGRIYELEVAGMGGVPGPAAHGEGREHQLFGYPGKTWAFGELSFSETDARREISFRLVDPEGRELETIQLA